MLLCNLAAKFWSDTQAGLVEVVDQRDEANISCTGSEIHQNHVLVHCTKLVVGCGSGFTFMSRMTDGSLWEYYYVHETYGPESGASFSSLVAPNHVGSYYQSHHFLHSLPLRPVWTTSSTESAKKRPNPLSYLFFRQSLQTLLLDPLASKQRVAPAPKVGRVSTAYRRDLTTATGSRSSHIAHRNRDSESWTPIPVDGGIWSEFAGEFSSSR